MLKKKLLVLFLIFLSCPESGFAGHALSISGEPKYPQNFSQFDYVNPRAPKGGKVKLAAIGGFDSLNQFILKGRSAAGLGLLYDSLLTPSSDEAFTAYGLIAKDVVVSKDRSSVTFVLHEDATFQDGHPIRAEDVKFTFDILKSKGHPTYGSYYGAISSVEVLSPVKVRFHFSSSENKELPLIIGQMPILPKHYWEERAFDVPSLDRPLGSGQYKIADVVQGRRIVYERVKDYWAQNLNVNVGRYNFDFIQHDYYRDADVALEAFKSGEYDFRQENIAKNWAKSYDFPAVTAGVVLKREIQHENPVGFQGFFFNARRDIFKDRNVRKALTLVFDFEWMNKNFFYSSYKRTQSFFENSPFVSPALPSGDQKKILSSYKDSLPSDILSEFTLPVFAGDGQIRPSLREAFKLLKESGWIIKNNQLVNAETGQPFSFEIMLVSPAFEKVAHAYSRNLEKLGIKTRIRLVDPSQYQQNFRKFNFDMVVSGLGQSLYPGNEQKEYWHSSRANEEGSRNIAGIQNKAIDALVEKIISSPSLEDVEKYTQSLDRALLFGYYAIPHWYIDLYRVSYWNKFAYPAKAPKYALGFLDTWWVDHNKRQEIENYLK